MLLTYATVASTGSLVGRSGTLLLGGQSRVILSSCDYGLAGSSVFELIATSERSKVAEIQY